VARYGVSILKSTQFRNVQQDFTNVYYYEAPVPETDTAQLQALVDMLVNNEKTVHSTLVNFKRARLWLTGTGSPATNHMVIDQTLSGAGSATDLGTLDRERAFLIRVPAGFNSRGKPVYLRKWYHTCAQVGGVAIGSPILADTTDFTAANRTAIANALKFWVNPTVGVTTWQSCSQQGRFTTGPASAHPFLEHHQLGDQWR
jgi:hypothetical protein